jgi:hypothetical protein
LEQFGWDLGTGGSEEQAIGIFNGTQPDFDEVPGQAGDGNIELTGDSDKFSGECFIANEDQQLMGTSAHGVLL